MTTDIKISRKLAENIAAYMEGSASGTVQLWHAKLLEALAAPVVERQDDALSKGFYTTQTGGGKYEINIGYRTLEELHAANQQMIELLRSRTAPVTVVPEGWKLVPIQPTMEMLKAVDNESNDKHLARGRAISAWGLMLDAAPSLLEKVKETNPSPLQ